MSEESKVGEGGIVECGTVRDLLPLRATGALDSGPAAAVEVHLHSCDECAGEALFVQSLGVARPEPPADLVRAVMARLPGQGAAAIRERAVSTRARQAGHTWRRAVNAWPLAAAASIILALGVGTMWMDRSGPSGAALLATLMEDSGLPGADEWMVAGAPVWDALPDDVLLVLLEEDSDV
jgi:predicted anti-sigma-YlaC factor YlaD